jgi:3-oxoacyl-[acyl-carrier protein] reductase
MLLKDKTALITGSNRGIGLAILENFAKQGCNIYAHSRKENKAFTLLLKKVSDKYNVAITNINFDIQDSSEIKKGIMTIIKTKIPLDILVNSAGIIHGGLFQMTSISSIRNVFDVNFFGMLEVTQIVSKYMTRYKKGSIINIASVAGIDLSTGNCAYGTSKAAMIAFSKTLSSELSSLGIRVNVIAPSLTDTDMAHTSEAQKERESLKGNKPFERMANPNEIADLVSFLASDNSSFINGEIIRIDGGNRF